jgi:hypothetical protein
LLPEAGASASHKKTKEKPGTTPAKKENLHGTTATFVQTVSVLCTLLFLGKRQTNSLNGTAQSEAELMQELAEISFSPENLLKKPATKMANKEKLQSGTTAFD